MNAVLAEQIEGITSIRDAMQKTDNGVRAVHICYIHKATGALTASLDSAFFSAGTSLSQRLHGDNFEETR